MASCIHGTCVAIGANGAPLFGALLLGKSGSGKSDLALRLIDGGAVLVADDQVELEATDGRLVARRPQHLPRLLEVRGVGLMPVPTEDRPVLLSAAFELCGEPERAPDRLPRPAEWRHQGASVPLYRIDPQAASAAARVRMLVLAAPVGAGDAA